LIRCRGGEDLSSTGRIKHAQSDEPAMQRLVTRASTRDQSYLVRRRSLATIDDAVGMINTDLWPSCFDAEQLACGSVRPASVA
jgi:hypothetical protein